MNRTDYYSDKLSAERLRRCYEIAPPRVRAYFDAEIAHVSGRIHPSDTVLELGCGYGRVLKQLAPAAGRLVGIDTSLASLRLATEELREVNNCHLVQTDAIALGLGGQRFDCVVCIQNGISAFHVDQHGLIAECLRVTRAGGRVLLSTYSHRFWDHRLDWFRLQSEHGLIGEIDRQATGDGVIVCKDGFKATTVSAGQFNELASQFDVDISLKEVDGSSLFCEIVVR